MLDVHGWIGRLLAVLVMLLGPACDAGSPAEPTGSIDEPFVAGKADGACVEPGSPAADGILSLVNDPMVSVAELDAPASQGGVGLDRRAAANIVAARPLATLQALDDVPYVGGAACRALAEYACNEAERCRAEVGAMTWNLRHFPLVSSTPADVAALVQQLRPAVVGIQEVQDDDAFHALAESLPGYGGFLGEPGPYTTVGVLYDASRLEVTAFHDLFVDDWYAFPRPVAAVTAYVRGSLHASVFTFAVVHLKASPGAHNEARRRNAIGKLRDWIDEERAVGHDRIIIAGDYNDRLTDPDAANVFTELGDAATQTTFLTREAEQNGGITLVPYDSMVDHILVTDELFDIFVPERTEVLALDETWSNDYLDRISDHRPARTTFSIPMRY